MRDLWLSVMCHAIVVAFGRRWMAATHARLIPENSQLSAEVHPSSLWKSVVVALPAISTLSLGWQSALLSLVKPIGNRKLPWRWTSRCVLCILSGLKARLT